MSCACLHKTARTSSHELSNPLPTKNSVERRYRSLHSDTRSPVGRLGLAGWLRLWISSTCPHPADRRGNRGIRSRSGGGISRKARNEPDVVGNHTFSRSASRLDPASRRSITGNPAQPRRFERLPIVSTADHSTGNTTRWGRCGASRAGSRSFASRPPHPLSEWSHRLDPHGDRRAGKTCNHRREICWHGIA